jgi:putative permease
MLVSLVIFFMGNIIAPVIIALVIAYLLEGVVEKLEKRKIPRFAAVLTVFIIFMLFMISLFLGFIPLLTHQIAQVTSELPEIFDFFKKAVMMLPEKFPDFTSSEQIQEIVTSMQTELGKMGHGLLSFSMSSIRVFVVFLIYLVLVPMIIFFFLKDKYIIKDWLSGFFPSHTSFLKTVWKDVDIQIGNYIRGKVWEILIVWGTGTAAFYILDLRYAMLNGLITGLSVLIPYVGAVLVFFPITIIAFFQWGPGSELLAVSITYLVIQFLDGNILAPLLMAEAVKIHPVAVLIAILVFGNLWGLWGVFFAIPLATLVRAIITAWPKNEIIQNEEINGNPD